VVGCGGGPAGIAAAVSAARAGARALLIEQYGSLGGIWTTGLVSYFLDYANKAGLMAEIVRRLESRGARAGGDLGESTNTFDVEQARLLMDELCQEAGVREGRRIHGRQTVTLEDMVAGRQRPDAVCRVTFGIDVHSTDPRAGKGIEPHKARTQPYDIPLGALQARDVQGLWLAGRCISGGFPAHSSYRVTGNAVAMGAAAGAAAAAAAKAM